MVATTLEAKVSSNAGATMPVMSSPVPRDSTIKVAIPASINMLTAIAEYFTSFKNRVESRFIGHLIMCVVFLLILPAQITKSCERRANPCDAASDSYE